MSQYVAKFGWCTELGDDQLPTLYGSYFLHTMAMFKNVWGYLGVLVPMVT